ncbi:hypothetical protein OQJ46_02475 [Microbulbifer thermotolerans]|uniref:hypothetical protein n=1 Tax=Microbulbifer thermotolerans TaxID=252514 RepID=UPI00224B7B15|nr:hypothetical protein [Microbulbifer thermotolerans]MCX2781852.1 hypothetical protein [Microbulbifer thermotolerans]MCX2834392.1 hypothetical protein [Microbulbifer thermotolerans]
MKKLITTFLFPIAASAADLETKSFLVNIKSNCGEGDVSCNQLIYKGTSKKSGNTITLKGSSWHTLCSDGVTPCRFLGYKFKNGNITYYVHQDGLLEVVHDRGKILVSEQGKWQE